MELFTTNRRMFLAGLAGVAAGSALPFSWSRAHAAQLSVGMLLPGRINDGGFMEAGYQGLQRIEKELGARVTYIDQIEPKPDLLKDALRRLASGKPDLVIAHGGQNSEAVKVVAQEFPTVQFAVVQGNVTGPNIASYEVLQEHSAWLGGALAGLMTKTGVVGHISGIRVPPGLKGRAAYAHGVKHTNPKAKLLTIFCGNQDDNELSHRVATAEIEAGADIIFTMLNAGRTGAIEACRQKGALQIGNVRDWIPDAPDVFIASAVANVSVPGFQAAQDFASNRFSGGRTLHIGLENPQAVTLTMASRVPPEVRATIESLAKDIVAGKIKVPTEWQGEEFTI